jgi:ABC-type antimicrobial peptide transport system permease subunit
LPGGAKGEQAIQAVIGEGLARELGPDQGKKALVLGDVFDLGGRKWAVVGIMKSSGSTFDSEVWAKHQLAGDLFGKKSYTTVVLRTADAESAQKLADDLTANYKKPAVAAQPEPAYYEKLNTTNQQFLVAIIIVVVIMAIGGVFGVMNTMFAAISARTKDIGVLRILGYARWQVLASFFLEALLLALLGGLLGCALGSLANGYSASSIVGSGQGGGKSVMLKLVVDGRILLAGLGFSLLMGCVGGLVPALSAMRLKPLEAVR